MQLAERAAAARQAAWEPVSGASVAFFRIAFGLGMIVNCLLYLPVLVSQYYVDTTFNFAYPPVSFLGLPPFPGMHLIYVAMIVCGGLIAVGLWYRWATGAFLILTTYVFLVDSTFFQNHEYLVSLLALLLLVLPADRMWSLDARRHPERASATVDRWVVWLLRFQIGVPYFYGGVAKLNGDWLRGEPLRAWLGARTDIEPISTLLDNGGVVWFMAYGALVLDLFVVGFLLHRRTRMAAYLVLVGFHLMNVWLWGLFIFPWLMIAATTIFFDPDWPLRVERWWRARQAAGAATSTPSAAAPPDRDTPDAADPDPPEVPAATASAPGVASGAVTTLTVLRTPARRATIAGLLTAWVLVQMLLPFRHLLIDGNPSWTERGHRFAWHMKLRDKQGTVTYVVTKPDGTVIEVDPADHLGHKQTVRLAGHPERLVLFAHHLSDLHGGAEVRARTWVSLNGRPPQEMVDPTVDLSAIPKMGWGDAEWIRPLLHDLPD